MKATDRHSWPVTQQPSGFEHDADQQKESSVMWKKSARKTGSKISGETSAQSLIVFLSKAREKGFHASASAGPDIEWRYEKYFVQ